MLCVEGVCMRACAGTHTQVYLAMTLYMDLLVQMWSKLCNVVIDGHPVV